MKKWIITILMAIMLAQIVTAACCELNNNCTIIETCQDGSCGTCYLTLYNQTGQQNQSGNMGSIDGKIYQYNLTTPVNEYGRYPYIINCSTGDECITGECSLEIKQTCEEIEMTPISMIIFIPIAIAFFYLMVSFLLRGKSHWAFSIALLLLAFVEFFRAYNYGILAIAKYYNWPEMQGILGSQVYNYGIMYGIVITYFIIHLLIIMTMGLWDKNKRKIGEYGEYDD